MTSSTSRAPLWLAALFVASFAIGTDDFVIAGILREIADELHVTESGAGQLVTAFALSYALAAPPAAVITARWSRRTVMRVAMALFAVGNLAAAFSPDFTTLLITRILLGITAATVSPAAVATAAALAPSGKRGRYISVVAAGLTVALAAGVPLGTWMGGQFGWRSTMVFVAVLSVLAVAGMSRLPEDRRPARLSLSEQLGPLRHPAVALALVTVLIGATGGLMTYQYIAPVVHELSGIDTRGLALIIAVTGVCGAIGSWLGGLATDRYGPERTTVIAIGCQATAMLVAAGLAWSSATVPPAVTAILFAAWSIGGWAFNPAMYTRLIGLARHAGAEITGLNNSALFLGISIAGGVGGAVLATWGAGAVPLTAALSSLLALGVFALSFARYPTPEHGATVEAWS